MRLELAPQSAPCWWARETVLPLIILSNRVRQDPEHDSWLWGHNFQGFRAPATSRPWEHTAPITPLHIRKCAYYDLHSATIELAVVPSMEKYQYLQERVFDLHPDNHPFFLRQNNIPILLGWEISPVNFSKENMWSNLDWFFVRLLNIIYSVFLYFLVLKVGKSIINVDDI